MFTNRPPRSAGIQAKMLTIILPMIAAPMLILAAVGFFTANREAANSSARYLAQREVDLRAAAENPDIRHYFNNTKYGLEEEAEVARQELEASLTRLVARSNNSGRVYYQARFIDHQGAEVAKAAEDKSLDELAGAAMETFFDGAKALKLGETYLSPVAVKRVLAMPVYQTREGQPLAFMGVVALDFSYALSEFQRTSSAILNTFVIGTLVSLGIALLLTVIRVRQFTNPIRQLAQAANRIATGERAIRVENNSRDEIGQLAGAFNGMAERLETDEVAIKRKIAETRTLYDVAQEITAQVHLEPTLKLIVDRARDLLEAEVGLLAMREENADTFAVKAIAGRPWEAAANLQVKAGEGLIGGVAATGQGLIVRDYLEEFPDSPFRQVVRESGLRSQVAVPLKVRDVVTGVLLVTSPERAKFDEADRQLLSALADHASIAIENARLLEQARHQAEELEARVEIRTRELQEANRKIEQTSRHKSEFLANMSHELRTPLNAIIGFSEVLSDGILGDLQPKHQEYVQDIHSSGQHLLSLINDILDLSKVEAGRMELDVAKFDVGAAINNAITLVRERAARHGVKLNITVDEHLAPFAGDERKFKQILLNLLSNAVKFTPHNGDVSVSASATVDGIQVAVSDSGIGISPENQQAIFEAFHQVSTGGAAKAEGTGLGLTLARQFVEMHAGRLWVESVPGKGSTFTFSLTGQPCEEN